MRRIARFLEIDVPEEKWPMLADAATFASMKRDAAVLGPEMGMIFEGGADRFLYKGTNDRWRDVLTADDLALYEAAAARTLTPELKRWLERRRGVGGRAEVGVVVVTPGTISSMASADVRGDTVQEEPAEPATPTRRPAPHDSGSVFDLEEGAA